MKEKIDKFKYNEIFKILNPNTHTHTREKTGHKLREDNCNTWQTKDYYSAYINNF